MKKLLTAALLAAASTLAAHAGTTPCTGTVIIDTVYQTSTGNGNFEYFFQLRNTTRDAVTANVSFAGFPRTDVSIFSPTLSNIKLAPNQNQQIRFGKGTNNKITNNVVSKFYDSRGSASGPVILVTGCTK